MADIFISYSQADKRFAAQLYRELGRFKVRGFMDVSDIGSGAELTSQLKDNIANSSALVVILSRAATRSNWVLAELGMAESLGKVIIPVLAPGEKYDDAVPAQLLDRVVLDASRHGVEETAARVVAAATNTSVDEARAQVHSRARRRQFLLGIFGVVGVTLALASFSLQREAVRQRDVAREAQARILRLTSGGSAFAISPDGQVIATSSADGTIQIWRPGTEQVLGTLAGTGGSVSSLAFGPSGRVLASAEWDGEIRLWDVQEGRLLRALSGHTGPVLSVGFAPDGSTLLSRSIDGTLRQWSVETGQLISVVQIPR